MKTSQKITKSGHNIILVIATLLFMAVLIYGAFFADSVKQASAGSLQNVSGYAWSDNIGWISFNCTDTGSCGAVNYGVNIATDGDMSGHAWSDNVGWITFNENELSGCPSGACKAKLSGNNLQGWARVLSNGDGWDGWISLNGPSYGVTKSGNNLVGYSWDASNISGESIGIGWIQFNPVFGGVTIAPDNPLTVDLSANPTSVISGGSSSLSWTSTNATSCEGTVGPANWLGSKTLSENDWDTGALVVDTVYRIKCTNALSSVEDTITVFIETPTQCSDGIDNDGDGQTDYPDDTSCNSSAGDDESIPICGNTVCETGENAGNCAVDCGSIKFEEF